MTIMLRLTLFLCLFLTPVLGQVTRSTLVEEIEVLKAQDELRFDDAIRSALKHSDPEFRSRAALAAGRIGDEKAIPALVEALKDQESVAVMATFGLGEIESLKAAETVSSLFADKREAVRFAAYEAAGKIVSSNREKPESKALAAKLLAAVKEQVSAKTVRESGATLVITSLLRSRPKGFEPVLSSFLQSPSARVRSDAANVIARLRVVGNETRLRELLKDKDAVVRANAARALGTMKDKESMTMILDLALTDSDRRVRTNSVSAFASFADKKSASKLIARGEQLLVKNSKSGEYTNEIISIAVATGRIFRGTANASAVSFLSKASEAMGRKASEVEIAMVRVSPSGFVERKRKDSKDWRVHAALAAALGEASEAGKTRDADKLKSMAKATFAGYLKSIWDGEEKPDMALSAVLSAYSKFEPAEFDKHLRNALLLDDVVTRATAARLLGERPVPGRNKLENYFALRDAFENSEKDILNDAQLAALDALEKQIKELEKDKSIIIDLLDPIKSAHYSPDYLVRRKAREIANNVGLVMETKPEKVSYSTKGNHRLLKPDYSRALRRTSAKAVFVTDKGRFEIEFYPKEAPLTVENFVGLARKGYFNGLAIHRVVPNFVMQDGDPRGDGSGGPGWHIRCEINRLRYERGTVGMALAGKDTGGSQWFVAHSPQPHLDGGYTVFGKVNESGMKVVDNLSRGDIIKEVTIEEKIVDTESQ